MPLDDVIRKRFKELGERADSIRPVSLGSGENILPAAWQPWATSVMHLIENVLGRDSVHARHFKEAYGNFSGYPYEFEKAKGVFLSAREDYESGYLFGVERTLTGEVLGDFIGLAKAALDEGHKDVAAVLASAALEDALKRYARAKSLSVDDKDVESVVNALKAERLVSGAQKSLLDTMPRIRNYALHANWDKLTPADVGSIIGFVEQFLLTHFS